MDHALKRWWKRRRCDHEIVKVIDGIEFPDDPRALGVSTQLTVERFHFECRKCDAQGKTEALRAHA